MKKRVLSGLLAVALVCGVTYKAAANPMFAVEYGNTYCKNGELHYVKHTYIFWFDFDKEVRMGQPCGN